MSENPTQSGVDRRDFIKTSVAGVSAVSLAAASYNRVYGINERIGVAFLGVGGRCQAHINHVLALRDRLNIRPVAVCDVWDGHEFQYMQGNQQRTYSQGLFPSARRCGLPAELRRGVVTKDYRETLENREVDVVCISTPDHWHARMAIDAAEAGKHVYCEKPMTRTIAEAHAVVDTMRRTNKVMTVGVQSMAEPRWRQVNELIRRGGIGHVAQAQTSYYRNYIGGQWRYYQLLREMNPRTIDWAGFLGRNARGVDGQPLGPDLPFDRAVFAQWRCYWPFGGGMFTDLFVHQTTHMIAAMGVTYPARVVGGGGIYLEYDGRDVPDVAAIVADYNEGCQLVVMATMINNYPIDEVIRGRLATVRFGSRGEGANRRQGYEVIDQNLTGGPGRPPVLEGVAGRFTETGPDRDYTPDLWVNFIECVRANNRNTMSTPELGAAAFTTVALGVQSYREGRVLMWDSERREARTADDSWATNWERMSRERARPRQIQGWTGGDAGSVIVPPAYMNLAGPWRDNNTDPAPMNPPTPSGRN
jgi:predicted dehydrogenase